MSGFILRELDFLSKLYAPSVFERIREFLIALSSVDTGICETEPGNSGRATSDDEPDAWNAVNLARFGPHALDISPPIAMPND